MGSPTMELLKKKQKEQGIEPTSLDEELSSEGPDLKAVEDSPVADKFTLPEPTDINKMVKKDLDELYTKHLEFLDCYEVESAVWHKWTVKEKKASLCELHEKLSSETFTTVEEVEEEPVGPVASEPTVEAAEVAGLQTDLDPFTDVLNTIESLETEEEAVKLAHHYDDQKELSSFYLGGVLSKMQSESWFNGYEKFAEFVETEFGFKYRKAVYLINIYNSLVSTGLSWSQVGHIGWKKLSMIAPKLTQENWQEWVEVAEGMTIVGLQEYIKQMNEGSDSEDAVVEAKKLKTKTFKLHDDQYDDVDLALKQVKEDTGTEYDSVALEYLCGEYMSGSAGKPKDDTAKPSPEEMLKGIAIDKLVGYTYARIKEELDTEAEQLSALFENDFEINFPNFELEISEK